MPFSPWLRKRYRQARRALGLAPRVTGGLPPAPAPAIVTPDQALGPYRVERLAARRRLYRAPAAPRTISFLTTVYDTPSEFLRPLAAAMFGQDSGGFEWVVLDNGSTRADTRTALAEIAAHPAVRFVRVDANLGIIGGMRRCLEQARGDYVAPLDSDDLVTSDCVRVLAAFIARHGDPAILYTDEDKIDGDRHFQAYAKPDWDPVLFARSCFIAHLCVFDRKTALAVGCYDDPATEGSHDWDTFVRFLAAGHTPAHLPELLYSWRLHAASTTADFRTKPYVFDSQKRVLEKLLRAIPTRHRYEVAPDPLFGGAPDWRFRALDLPETVPIAQIVVGAAGTVPSPRLLASRAIDQPSIAALADALVELPAATAFVHLHDARCSLPDDGWIEEATALLDLYPDAAVIGGRVHDRRVILSSGYVFGFGEPISCPDKGRPVEDPGYFAQVWKPRSVAAVSPRHCVVRLDVLRATLAALPPEASFAYLGAWLGAHARAAGLRVVYTPHLEAIAAGDWDKAIAPEEKRRWIARHGTLLRDRVGYGTAVRRVPGQAFMPGDDETPAPRPGYPDWIAWRIADRLAAHPAPAGPAPLSLLTCVYQKTDVPAFEALRASIAAQTTAPLEWLVLAHGPISEALDAVLDDLAHAGAATVLRLPTNLGISGGQRYCLERARGAWVTAIDADDLLTPDAVALIAETIAASPSARLLYTDEDALLDGEPCWPCLRPDFDPVLLTHQSYVNHAIVFDRAVGLELGAFDDAGAEYAQDWEILRLFWQAGHTPAHLPEIVYRWRKHRASISQSGSVFDGTFRSVTHILEQIRARAARPDLYEVAPCPIDLGIGDIHLRRKPIALPAVTVIRLGPTSAEISLPQPWSGARQHRIDADQPDALGRLLETVSADDATLALVVGRIGAPEADGLWDAVKQLELFDDALAVSGRLIDRAGHVLVGCPVELPDGTLADPARGRPADDPNAYSIALKPHTISVACIDLLLARRGALADALRTRPAAVGLAALGCWLGVHAARSGRRVIHAPLLRATVDDPATLIGDDTLAPAWRWMSVAAGLPTRAPRRGLGPPHLAALWFAP